MPWILRLGTGRHDWPDLAQEGVPMKAPKPPSNSPGTAGPDAATPVLKVRDLVTRFHTDQGVVHAVNGVSYSLNAGETLAIVGESGSGKTVAALSVLGLVPQPPGRVEEGEVILGGRDLLKLSAPELRKVRGREIAMIFQDPMTSLNPVLTIGYQLTEALRHHLAMGRAAARARTAELLRLVGIPNPGERMSDHPHELSGGQRQRVMIAMALSCGPKVLIADEPTTALDVTIQAQIVELVKELQGKLGMAILWITHDLALVAGLAHRVAVMYAGFIVEEAPVRELYAASRHPYTVGLLRSLPRVDSPSRGRLAPIEGQPPDLLQPPRGCPFAPRCAMVVERCLAERPLLTLVGPGHSSACWRWDEVGESPGGSP
jgi:oligopeptide transport system ATP-binding protein